MPVLLCCAETWETTKHIEQNPTMSRPDVCADFKTLNGTNSSPTRKSLKANAEPIN